MNNAALPLAMPLVPSTGLVPATFIQTLQSVRVTIADFDGDGKNDIALALMARNQDPYVGILQNQGLIDDILTFVPTKEMRMSQPFTS